jgi:hypothetical protein
MGIAALNPSYALRAGLSRAMTTVMKYSTIVHAIFEMASRRVAR